MTDLLAKVRALLGALPAQIAAAQAVLAVVATQVVPLLPDNAAVRVAAVLTAAAGWLALAASMVARVTRVPGSAVGLLVPAGRKVAVLDVRASTPVPVDGARGARVSEGPMLPGERRVQSRDPGGPATL